MMNRIFRIKPHLRQIIVDDIGVFLIGERERYLLSDSMYSALCPLLDGYHTEWELIEALGDRLSPPEVFYALERLLQEGHITEVVPELPADQAAFWESINIDAKLAAERLQQASVTIENFSELTISSLIDALQNVGIAVRDQDESLQSSLHIVLAEDYLQPELESINQRMLEQNQPWFLLKPGGSLSWIGPLFQPNTGPCWFCLANRLRANRSVEAFLQRRTDSTSIPIVPVAFLPLSLNIAFNTAVMVIARHLLEQGNIANTCRDTVLTFDHGTLEKIEHRVVQRPQCPVCGDSGLMKKQGEAAIDLTSQPKSFSDDGGYRCLTPEQTYQRYRHHISPISGILHTLEPAPERDHPLRPVYRANFMVCPVNDEPEFHEFHQISLGKGRTREQSRASALGESLERWSTLFQGDEPHIRASIDDLVDAAIHPHDLMNFSEVQYRNREQYNQQLDDWRKTVTLPFDRSCTLDWTPVWSLTHQCRRYVPTAFCYSQYPVPAAERVCSFMSNGNAAGNNLEEAILQGFFELVERDAIAIWWYNRVRRPEVDLASFGDAYFTALYDHYQSMGWRLWVLDLTADMAIPTFTALVHSSNHKPFFVGFGCHLDARLALQRALTEMNQLFDPNDVDAFPWDVDAIEDPSYLFPR